MKNDTKLLIIFSISIILIIFGAVLMTPKTTTRNDLEPFAKCISDKNAKFYGAFWCPHCQDQKKLFGTAKNLIPYIECSTPDGNGQLQVCADAKIDGYPTWVFSDGSTLSGSLSLEELAEKTSCELPVSK